MLHSILTSLWEIPQHLTQSTARENQKCHPLIGLQCTAKNLGSVTKGKGKN